MSVGLLCPVLTGRENELEVIVAALEDSVSGQGRLVVLTGEAGVGKTRLAREAAAQAGARGLSVIWGRASDGEARVPFRLLMELAATALRRLGKDNPLPGLEAYRPALARLVPFAGAAPSPDASPVVLAEALLRLLGAAGGLAVLEDLHWADADTLDVVEYLADNVAEMPVLLLATLRTDEVAPAAALTRSLLRRGSAAVVDLTRLDPHATMRMTAACLGLPPGWDPPAEIAALVCQSADGLPLLVEDLLTAAARGGSLVHDGAAWRRVSPLTHLRPISFADTVRERLRRLDGRCIRVLSAAAIFGQRFPNDLLSEVASVPTTTVNDALHAASTAGIVVREARGIAFRHALTATAVLDELLPAEQADLARRAAGAVSAAHPRLEGPWCVIAANLRSAAGDRAEAAQLLLTAGCRALDIGAVAGAVVLLERGITLADDSASLVADLGFALLKALVASGDAARSDTVAHRLLPLLVVEAKGRLIHAHLLLARVHLRTGWTGAAGHVAAARAAASDDASLTAAVDAVDALLALESERPDRLEAAEALARRASATAEATHLGEIGCEALEVIGRCARMRDLDAAESAFAQQLEIAESNDLNLWRIRAVGELGVIDMLRRASVDRVLTAHQAMLDAGMVLQAAGYAINIAVIHTINGRYEEAMTVARQCEATARRLGAEMIARSALAWQATVAAHRGQRSQMVSVLARVGPAEGGDVAVTVWGVCRAMLSLLDEDRPAALAAYERAEEAHRRMPALTLDPFGGQWLLVRLMEGVAGEADVAILDRSVPGTVFHRVHSAFAEAIVRGRAGHPDEAAAAVLIGAREAIPCPLYRHLYLRLVAEAALAEHWGGLQTWVIDALVEAEAWFIAHGHQRVTSACRRLLRQAGVATGRGGGADTELTADLRRRGVTAREAEVLRLLERRMTNRAIATRLFLSPRTVEKHVASLLDKLDARSRTELGTP